MSGPAAAQTQAGFDETSLADLEGGRWGISLIALDGTPLIRVNADKRFVPGSTLKLVTTASAFHYLGDYGNAGWPQGTALYRQQSASAPYPDLILVGSGDATLSSGEGCEENCLDTLVEAARTAGLTDIHDIQVDDSLFEPPTWPDGWSHEDLRFGYGSAISALSIDDAIAKATIEPGPAIGAAPALTWLSPIPYPLDVSQAETVASGFELELHKQPAAPGGQVFGTIGRTLSPVLLELGLDDPSLQAGRVFRDSLARHGIRVHGEVTRRPAPTEAPVSGFTPQLISRLAPPDPRETLRDILYDSNNFHAETLLHHVSLVMGDKTEEAGLDLMTHLLLESGTPETQFNLVDGSGLSFYNRVSPDTLSNLLVWASQQPWFEEWSSLLAASGQNGTLEHRLASRSFRGVLRAKSGTVFGADALAGYFTAESGQTVAFSVIINDSALSHAAARAEIDAFLKQMIRAL
ncbi:D-alanyl-D-alanine carboxypeptidase/D-alanyl-D-alanine endopeptidase [Henriciella aquimarina]|uniref:D-alanyl-D-alanine carboxypeptidase/D-alanyl-D-alanine endopeptidase n=1 Tax=Henriciella aquimarina TaxID=545261 RepID=UPI001301DA3D|nr:D-alanyl-D-alanine carboxypeptidase/D-alanyl-D-alanine-endopeptidase [Henriciella aquimarina]